MENATQVTGATAIVGEEYIRTRYEIQYRTREGGWRPSQSVLTLEQAHERVEAQRAQYESTRWIVDGGDPVKVRIVKAEAKCLVVDIV